MLQNTIYKHSKIHVIIGHWPNNRGTGRYLTNRCPVVNLKTKKKGVADVTALLESLTALLEYLDLFSNI